MSEQVSSNSLAEDRECPPLPPWWWIAIGLAVLFRMYVVGDDDVIPQVYDSTYYAQTAAYYFSDDPFSILPIHRPGLPILTWALAELGVPWKLFLDLLLVLAATWSGVMLYQLIQSRLASLCLVLAIVLHPWFMVHSQMFMTEPLVAILLLVMLLSSIPLICRPYQQWSCLATVAAALAACVYVLARNEFLLLLGFYGLIFVAVLIRQGGTLGKKTLFSPGGWRLAFLLFPVVAAWGSVQAVKAYNEFRFGVTALCATESAGFTDLMNARYSIEPEESLRFVPVPRKSIADACRFSPVLASHQSRLLDSDPTAYRITKSKFNIEGEVGTWLNWHLVDCFGGINRNSESQMRVAAREIRNALNRGDLPKRVAWFPCDPNWKLWLPELPSEFFQALRSFTYEYYLKKEGDFLGRHVENSVERSFFDVGLLSRGGTGFNRSIWVNGKAASPDSGVTAAQILTIDEELVAEVPIRQAADGLPEFNISLDDSENVMIRKPLFLRLVRGGESDSLSSNQSLKGKARLELCFLEFAGEDEETIRERWVLSFNRFVPKNKFREIRKQNLIEWPWAGFLLVLIAAFGSALFSRNGQMMARDLGWIALVGLSFVSARSLFYCLINVWLGWGLLRHVQPNLFICLFSLVCLSFLVGLHCSRFIKRKHSHSEAEDVPDSSNLTPDNG